MMASPSCPCGDPRQDINHIIFRCPLFREKSHKLRHHLSQCDPPTYHDLLPSIKSPSPKLCRLLVAFFKSSNISI